MYEAYKKTNIEKIRVYLFDVGFACIISNNPLKCVVLFISMLRLAEIYDVVNTNL